MKKAQESRKEKILNTLVRYGSLGIMSRRDFIDMVVNNDGHCEVKEVPSVRYNRRKWNRMYWDEQREYQKKMDKKKKEYRAFPKGDSTFFIITKTEYDYFISKKVFNP